MSGICAWGQTREIKLYLETQSGARAVIEEVTFEQLQPGFYLYRLDDQEQYSPPRIPRDEIPKIIERAREKVTLTTCNMPFAHLCPRPKAGEN